MTKLLLLIGLNLFWVSVHAITVEELLVKVNESNKGVLSYNTTYLLFKGHDVQQAYNRYSGYYYQGDGQVYQKIKEMELVYAKDFFIKLNSEEKEMTITDPQNLPTNSYNPQNTLKYSQDNSLEDKGSFYLVTVNYLQKPNVPLSHLSMKISKEYELLEIEMFYRQVQNFAKKRGEQDFSVPRLKIIFEEIDHRKEREELFEQSKYFIQKGNAIQPAAGYSGFVVIDNRTKK